MQRMRGSWLPMLGPERFGGPLRWYHRATWRAFKLVRWILWIRTTGMKSLPKKGAAVVIAPHLSYSDSFPCLYSSLPRPPRFLASAFFSTVHPVASWLSFLGGVVPVWRHRPDAGAVRRVLRLLAQGELVVFFPEGGRTWTGAPTVPMPSAAKLLARLRVPIYVASIAGAYDHWPRWDERPRLRKMRVRLSFQLALPCACSRPQAVQDLRRRWWGSVYLSGGRVDVEQAQATIRAALRHAAAGERETLDLFRKRRLAALPRLVCFCPECGLPRTTIHREKLVCRACGAAWMPDRDGVLRRVGRAESLDALFTRMAERLERRAAEAFGLEEPVEVRSAESHPGSGKVFVAGTACMNRGGLRVATALREWKIPLRAAAAADVEGSRVVALRAEGGERLHLLVENGALRLVLAARALLGLPISGLAP